MQAGEITEAEYSHAVDEEVIQTAKKDAEIRERKSTPQSPEEYALELKGRAAEMSVRESELRAINTDSIFARMRKFGSSLIHK